MKSHTLTGVDEFAALLARIFIGGFFAVSGANNLLNLGEAIQQAAEVGIPAAGLFVFTGAFLKCVLGILVIINLHTKIAASLMVIYLMIISMLFYGPLKWESYPLAEPIFMRNLAMLGGVLLLFAHSRSHREMAEYSPKKRERTRRRRRERTEI